MSQSCGNLEFIDGGTITNTSILNSQITNSRISNSVLDSSRIESLSSIDSDSARVIADAISQLSADQLKALAEALFAALAAKPVADPVSSESDDIPTVIFGNRAAVLGTPDMFARFDSVHSVPLYRIS